MGKTLKKKAKEKSKKKDKSGKHKDRSYKPVMLELKKPRYCQEDLDFVLEKIKENVHPQEIHEQIPHLTSTQIKKIRLIFNKGEQEDIDDMYQCKWYLSSIKNVIQWKQKQKKKNKLDNAHANVDG